MSNLAGRKTYLSFGILAGVSIATVTSHFANTDTQPAETIQIVIAAFTGLAGCMSALAAYQSSIVTKKTHDNATKLHEIRLRGAISVIKQTLDILQDPGLKRHEPVVFENIEGYVLSCQLIEMALMEPLNEDLYQALWQSRAAIQQLCAHHKEDGHITPRRREWVEGMLTGALEALPEIENK